MAVSTALNNVWHGSEDTAIDLSTNVTYCDRLRLREPGDKSFALQEHVDGGSVERKFLISVDRGCWLKSSRYSHTCKT